MVDILIRDGYIVTMDEGRRVFERGYVAVEDGRITGVGSASRMPKCDAETVIDASKMAVIPGFINCHTHAAMTLMRGFPENLPLETWLEKVYSIEAHMTGRDCYDGALLGCLEMITSGITTFCDKYFYEDHIAKAVGESGMRAVLCNTVRGEEELNEVVDLCERIDGSADGRVTAGFGPHRVLNCSPDFLGKVREVADRTGMIVHVHLSETLREFRFARETHGSTPVGYLWKTGLLGPKVLAAHCIHVDYKDISLLAHSGVKIAHCPCAAMKIAMGAPDVSQLIRSGVTVGIGTDGPASNNTLDMLREMKEASLLAKIMSMDPTALPEQKVLEMATIDGAKALGLDREIGSLEVGKKADITLISLDKPHLTPMHNPFANFVYSANGADVDTVIIDGVVVMEKRRVRTLDEKAVTERAIEASQNLL